jgi:CRISPR system Cascade subunit CasB
MSECCPLPSSLAFVRQLEALERGDRARLKRHAGQTLSQATDVLRLFYGILPAGVPVAAEEAYFLVATLHPLAAGEWRGDLGSSLRRATGRYSDRGRRRRLESLLQADDTQLPFRLRKAVRLLHASRARVDWACLLDDLLSWNLPDRSVQRRWARSYFGVHSRPDDKEAPRC